MRRIEQLCTYLVVASVSFSVAYVLVVLSLPGTPTPAPCADALQALIDLHPECSHRLKGRDGLRVVCIGGDIVIDGIIASSSGSMSSFLYTEERTLKQGICDCDRPEGTLACEYLP